MMLRSTGELAKHLGISRDSLANAVQLGAVRPPKKVGGKYVWNEEDLNRAKRYFKIKKLARAQPDSDSKPTVDHKLNPRQAKCVAVGAGVECTEEELLSLAKSNAWCIRQPNGIPELRFLRSLVNGDLSEMLDELRGRDGD